MRLVTDFYIAGLPATKGSMTRGRGGRGLRQSSAGYAVWTDTVRKAAVADTAERAKRGDWSPVLPREAGMVRCTFWVPLRGVWPSGVGEHYDTPLWREGDGDGDKLERLVWDALTKARIWPTDAAAIEWAGSRRYADDRRVAGAHCTVYAIDGRDLSRDDDVLMRRSEAAYRRSMYGETFPE